MGQESTYNVDNQERRIENFYMKNDHIEKAAAIAESTNATMSIQFISHIPFINNLSLSDYESRNFYHKYHIFFSTDISLSFVVRKRVTLLYYNV